MKSVTKLSQLSKNKIVIVSYIEELWEYYSTISTSSFHVIHHANFHTFTENLMHEMHAIYNKNGTLNRTKPLAGWLLLLFNYSREKRTSLHKNPQSDNNSPHYRDAFSLTNKIFSDSAVSKRFDGYCYAISLEKSRLGRRIHAYGTGREAKGRVCKRM